MSLSWEAVIGLECHAQLSVQSKLFCSCSTKFGAEPNANTCPVCLGYPGALPVLNRAAVDLAVRAALGLSCEIREVSEWSRKNYFYPDLPKGYQISQYDRPIAENGSLHIGANGSVRAVRIRRIHMEEDAGKSVHEGFFDSNRNSYLDFNRSGVPLVEIVTEPDLRSALEAVECLTRLKQILEFLGVCDGNMEEGSLRCDANVSIRRSASEPLGTRAELKNINSFRFLQKAIDYEIERQAGILESGGTIVQETRLWNSVEERTVSMRSKEDAHDYRYFPEPDLPPLVVPAAAIEDIRRTMPELPDARKNRFVSDLGLSEYDATVLTSTRALADFFEEVSRRTNRPKPSANWVMGDLSRLFKENGLDPVDLSASPVSPAMLAEMIELVEDGTISGKTAKTVLEEMYVSGKTAAEIVKEKGLVQISDAGEIERVVDEVLAANSDAVAQYQSGKTGALGFLVGQVMKSTGGRANPKAVNELFRKRLAG